MGELLKHEAVSAEHTIHIQNPSWIETFIRTDSHQYQKVIKAGNFPLPGSETKNNSFPGSKHEPAIEPMYDNGFISGINIICSCGEKIIVYFEFDENEKSV